MNRYALVMLLAVALGGNLLVAADPGGIGGQLSNIMTQIQTLVPVVALLMIVLAGLVYAAGQVMGAEMRSRASVWATSLLVGAIIGLILAASAGPIVSLFSEAAIVTT